ncbi:Fpg/Nei family DNA glycosylase [Auraticoccus monumenti]|uniref:Formamidopyrimidine-DNA glycosylase n=1 Tax=Auraticoccus monumenti TaxID=675864 RepID=A0A1G6SK58_9ACTN|nr:DNA-formamidopyrimidine glycosylase family protein [Auraticoccus monumenti]SDD17292.1 formamidopyrimidine-DNA glycosylase [Auraticoccus monumenti]
MPEMPEVESLRRHLVEHCVGKVVARAELAAFSALKTFDPPLSALQGLEVTDVQRFGKFLALDADGVWLVFHLARAGWLRWRENIPPAPARPGKGPLALRVVLDDDSGFDLTEAGTQRKLAVYVVGSPQDVPHIATLGPDPMEDAFGRPELDAVLERAGRAQLKGVLRDQRVLAGIGNAYSDEILHAARMSPFKPASSLDDAERDVLLAAVKGELGEAIERSKGRPASELKDQKRSGMAVHGRAGEVCPVCGDTVAEVSFADSSLQYCPTCQTQGKKLADRRMSRLLK